MSFSLMIFFILILKTNEGKEIQECCNAFYVFLSFWFQSGGPGSRDKRETKNKSLISQEFRQLPSESFREKIISKEILLF